MATSHETRGDGDGFGPIELFVVEFPGESPDRGVISALQDLGADGLVALVDLVVVVRRSDMEIVVTEFAQGDGAIELIGEGLVGQDDIDAASVDLGPGRGVALAALEMRWATELASALARAGGKVADVALIPAHVVNALVGAAASIAEEN
ncbi:DUF6325 family protein [Occultella kanbiaonis]|uniref:DUF6325 family protein n=1 Tax=Occultella kanbiaonis TaxID=2675754 RepID=UPI001F443C91|nr:DUF6325 family protein [Occultella kanbiaonis]